MKISVRMLKALNEQISMEAYASNYYLSVASWCEAIGYEGSAGFFFRQIDEERQHMLKVIHYLTGIGINPVIPSVEQPPKTFNSLEAACKTALKNEEAVTKSIYNMVEFAQEEKDYNTYSFLQWFVDEQMEEEKSFGAILHKFDLIGRDKYAINEIDKALMNLKSIT